MKDLPVGLPTPPGPAPAWLLPMLAGSGYALIASMMGLYGRRKGEMTKLEKACLTFVLAITERAEGLEEQRVRLTDRLAEAESKLATEKARADRLDRLAEEKTTALIEAEAKVRELETKLTQRPMRASRR